jgi:adenylate kinase
MEVVGWIALILGVVSLATGVAAMRRAVVVTKQGESKMLECVEFIHTMTMEIEKDSLNLIRDHMNSLHLELKRELQAMVAREMNDIRKYLLRDTVD